MYMLRGTDTGPKPCSCEKNHSAASFHQKNQMGPIIRPSKPIINPVFKKWEAQCAIRRVPMPSIGKKITIYAHSCFFFLLLLV